MSVKELDEVLEKINLLEPDEQQHVMSVLSEKVTKQDFHNEQPILNWAVLDGLLPYPACGEDAQEYITHTRREAEEQRDIH